MGKKLFSFTIEEQNGEQEYFYIEYVWAENLDEATLLARDYTSGFYDEAELIEEDRWSIYTIEWQLASVGICKSIVIKPINGEDLLLDTSN